MYENYVCRLRLHTSENEAFNVSLVASELIVMAAHDNKGRFTGPLLETHVCQHEEVKGEFDRFKKVFSAHGPVLIKEQVDEEGA